MQPVPHAEAVPHGLAPGFVKMEEEVERRKRRDAEMGIGQESPAGTVAGFKHIGAEVLTYMRDKHGVTPEQIAAAQDDIEKQSVSGMRELQETQRAANWRQITAEREEFTKPFNFDLVPPGVQRESVDAVLNWQHGPKGLFIIGETGRTKTRAVFAMLRRVTLEEQHKTLFFDGIEFATACSAAFSEPSKTEQWLRTLTKVDVLVIDDLAKRFTPATQEGFFAVMDRRTSAMKPVIITTNCSGEMLEQMIDEKHRASLAAPMRRRIREHTRVVVF